MDRPDSTPIASPPEGRGRGSWRTWAGKLNLRRHRLTVAGIAVIALGVPALFYACAWIFRPDVRTAPPAYSPAEVTAASVAQHPHLDLAHPPRITQEVDYSTGAKSAWWPKGEAPVLAELVEEGRLPPVAERIGSEPIVMQGVDGIGRYGGTWHRLAASDFDVQQIASVLSYANLVRWSPQGYPIVPHLAKSWEISSNYRVFTFHLRKGMKWSDGVPVTADDFTYWYDMELKALGVAPPQVLRYPGTSEVARVEKVDDYTVRFSFSKPWTLFLERLASTRTIPGPNCEEYCVPAHFLRKYHPIVGDQALIQRTMRELNFPTPRALYWHLKDWRDPLQPRLWPWILRTPAESPPYVFVRNPYYPVVDTAGNQLPYLDRVVFDVRAQDLFGLTAAAGQATMQDRYIRFQDHVLLSSQAHASGYQVYYWYPGERSAFTIFPNLNRRVDPTQPATAWKHRLLNEPGFRQALSLAIDRRSIIAALFDGQGEPAQLDPGPDSKFYSPDLFHSYTNYDPSGANQRLDALGLTRRDSEGYRTFPDGSRMVWYLNLTETTNNDPAQFIVDDWAAVGVRCVPLIRGRLLWTLQQNTFEHDFAVHHGESEFIPLVEPRNFVPTYGEAFYAAGFGFWYLFGGLNGAVIDAPRAIAPPPDHPLRRSMEILNEIYQTPDPLQRIALFHKIQETSAQNVWTISIATPPPQLVVVKDGFRNVPRVAVAEGSFETPGNAGLETYFWNDPHEAAGITADLKSELSAPLPEVAALGAAKALAPAAAGEMPARKSARWPWTGTILFALVVAAGFRWPYVGRRLLLMIPTLAVISVVVFTIVQAPPGDFATVRELEYASQGTPDSAVAIRELRTMFHLDDPPIKRYLRWTGLLWFATFKDEDTGLLEGNLGRSMEFERPVQAVVGDRIMLTVVVSLATVLLTWTIAIPIGIYSAAKQYSIGDYLLTFLGFLGMSVPAFLLALVAMYFSHRWFGLTVSGLFSPEFETVSGWSWLRAADLLKHLWLPIVVLGFGGTAGMIRIMRANLLDELRKPYVTTARAKGVPPLRLLIRYPVRLALNPFVSGIGSFFPDLISGGAIVAIVLSLPMVGPVLLNALLSKDVELAASMLLVMSFLGIAGTLVSDLLLMALDPRIRLQSRSR